uniref:Uncharacterized protein n=1 Tax=Lynx canadensis TaxID=61383 RepID=A0A667IUH8_LYNCA
MADGEMAVDGGCGDTGDWEGLRNHVRKFLEQSGPFTHPDFQPSTKSLQSFDWINSATDGRKRSTGQDVGEGRGASTLYTSPCPHISLGHRQTPPPPTLLTGFYGGRMDSTSSPSLLPRGGGGGVRL